MRYPYRCACGESWEVEKQSKDYARPEPCPVCGNLATEQDYSQKSVGGFVNSEGAWSEGKLVAQLHPYHPDRMVTSKRQMEKVYRKHGISLDTGHYTSKEAQIKATLPRRKLRNLGKIPTKLNVGGVIDEKN